MKLKTLKSVTVTTQSALIQLKPCLNLYHLTNFFLVDYKNSLTFITALMQSLVTRNLIVLQLKNVI